MTNNPPFGTPNQNDSSIQAVNINQTETNLLFTQDLFPELSKESIVYMRELNNGCMDCCCSWFNLNCSQNVFEVYSLGEIKTLMYTLKEEEIDICPCDCRGFKMSINNASNNNAVNIMAQKDCKCAGYGMSGCGKPSVYVKVISPQNVLLGRIKFNFNCCLTLCCTHRLEIRDSSDQILYTIISDNCICPIGLECFCWGKCFTYKYLIIKGENREDHPVGTITKLVCEKCYCDCLTKSDSYNINFPPNSTSAEKMMFIIAATFIDHNTFFA